MRSIFSSKRKAAESEADQPGVSETHDQEQDGLFVEQEVELAADSGSERAPAKTPKETGAHQRSEADSARSSPSSEDDDDVEIVACMIRLPSINITRSSDEIGNTVRKMSVKCCHDLVKVFRTRPDKGAKKLHLAFRGASVTLEKANTLEKLRTNLRIEVMPFLGDARSIATSEFNTYEECENKIQDYVDKKHFRTTILSRSETKLKVVEQARDFYTRLLADLSQQRQTLLREKIPLQAAVVNID